MKTYSLEDFLKYSSELATISPAVVELINKINLPNTRRDEIAKLISLDEVLLANIFKYTNSAAFALSTKPRNISEALQILGVNEVRNIVFSVAAKKVFVDLELWHKSVFTAVAAQKISKNVGLNPNLISDIYIASLMHSIGTLVFKIFYKDEYSSIEKLEVVSDKFRAEEQIFGINNLELAYEILRDFNLPDSITEIIKKQASILDTEDIETENAVIDLAICLSEIKDEYRKNQKDIDKFISPEIMTKLNLSEFSINPAFIQEVQEETNNIVQNS